MFQREDYILSDNALNKFGARIALAQRLKELNIGFASNVKVDSYYVDFHILDTTMYIDIVATTSDIPSTKQLIFQAKGLYLRQYAKESVKNCVTGLVKNIEKTIRDENLSLL